MLTIRTDAYISPSTVAEHNFPVRHAHANRGSLRMIFDRRKSTRSRKQTKTNRTDQKLCRTDAFWYALHVLDGRKRFTHKFKVQILSQPAPSAFCVRDGPPTTRTTPQCRYRLCAHPHRLSRLTQVCMQMRSTVAHTHTQ